MSRTFVDENLQTWEVFPSGGRFGLPERPKIVFLCLSDTSPASRGRYVILPEGDEATAQDAVADLSDARLRELLAGSRALD
jgi:hypothetical protein